MTRRVDFGERSEVVEHPVRGAGDVLVRDTSEIGDVLTADHVVPLIALSQFCAWAA